MLDAASDPTPLAPSPDRDDETREIRLLAASARSPLALALREEIEALEPSRRPRLIALLRRADDADAAALAALGATVRRLSVRGGDALREHVARADSLWLGAPVSAARPAQPDEARRLERSDAPDAFDAARLAFDTAWTLSAPSAMRRALETAGARLRELLRGARDELHRTAS